MAFSTKPGVSVPIVRLLRNAWRWQILRGVGKDGLSWRKNTTQQRKGTNEWWRRQHARISKAWGQTRTSTAVWVHSQEILERAKEAALTREIGGCLRPVPGTPDGRGLWGVPLRKGRFCPHWGAGHRHISFCQNPLKCTLKMGAFYWGKLYINNDDLKTHRLAKSCT